MHSIFLTGILLLIGLVSGEAFKKLKLPKITGYLLAGFFLVNFSGKLIPETYSAVSTIIITLALTFISFEIGGQLSKNKLSKLGSPIIWITIFASLWLFVFVLGGFCLFLLLNNGFNNYDLISIIIPTSLLLAALSAPTDPNPVLAIAHEEKVEGPLITTLFGISALDDLLGVFLFVVAFAVCKILVINPTPLLLPEIGHISFNIFISICAAIVLGMILKYACPFLEKETDGVLIIVLFGFLCLISGLKSFFDIDVVISGMVFGWFTRNYVHNQHRLFSLLERYSEEMIVLLFFILSGLHLKIGGLLNAIPYIVIFIALRGFGKYVGVKIGCSVSNAPKLISENIFGGVLPQGGIVIGLALLVFQTPEFNSFSSIVFNTILGATIIHEIGGPLLILKTLRKSGYIK